MVLPKLYVVFYQPCSDNYQHWGLYLDNEEELLIFEVTDEHLRFECNVVRARPERSRSFLQKLYIAVISKDDIELIKHVAKMVPVDNKTVEWDCQKYVLDLLDKLEDKFILEKDDEDYHDVRETLMEKRGAIV